MLATTVIYLLLTTVAARSSNFFASNGQQVLEDPKIPVPGDNPLVFCQDASEYSLSIENVDLLPNPPKAGAKLVIEATGTFTEEIEEGAYVHLSVKWGLITLIKTTADLCQQLKEVNEDCPLSGKRVIRKEVDLPKQVPPGTYHVLGDVFTKDDQRITCMEATVHFDL